MSLNQLFFIFLYNKKKFFLGALGVVLFISIINMMMYSGFCHVYCHSHDVYECYAFTDFIQIFHELMIVRVCICCVRYWKPNSVIVYTIGIVYTNMHTHIWTYQNGWWMNCRLVEWWLFGVLFLSLLALLPGFHYDVETLTLIIIMLYSCYCCLSYIESINVDTGKKFCYKQYNNIEINSSLVGSLFHRSSPY